MKEILVHGNTLPEAYHRAILALREEGELFSCKDWDQDQRELSMTFVAQTPLAEPMISKLYIGGARELQQYTMEILDGILDFKIGDGWAYTYHDRMFNHRGFDQIAFAINELRRSNDSRRAVAIIRDNDVDASNDDPACLQHLQYFIRNDALHCKVLMRSNDATKASFMNAFAFVMLQKRIADTLGLPVGSYTHRANSFHCYEKDFKLLEQYAKGIKTQDILALTYRYDDFYKELMEDAIPEINQQVAELRKNKGL